MSDGMVQAIRINSPLNVMMGFAQPSEVEPVADWFSADGVTAC